MCSTCLRMGTCPSTYVKMSGHPVRSQCVAKYLHEFEKSSMGHGNGKGQTLICDGMAKN